MLPSFVSTEAQEHKILDNSLRLSRHPVLRLHLIIMPVDIQLISNIQPIWNQRRNKLTPKSTMSRPLPNFPRPYLSTPFRHPPRYLAPLRHVLAFCLMACCTDHRTTAPCQRHPQFISLHTLVCQSRNQEKTHNDRKHNSQS
jgi:hypothetical protein